MIPVGIIWHFYLKPIGQEFLTLLPLGLMVRIYYWTKRQVRMYYYKLINRKSSIYKELPNIDIPTSEHLIDSFDIEILRTLDELREEKNDYLKIFPSLSSIMHEEELVNRFVKLRSIGLIRVQPSRITLTPAGFETLSTPSFATKAIVPSRFSSMLVRARIMLDENNFNGIMDTINILFEEILKSRIEEKFGDKLESIWKDLLKNRHVNVFYNRASLGVLLGASRQMGIIARNSISDHLLSTFLKLRNPEKHASKIKSDPIKNARSSLELAQIFVRYWFHE